MQLLWADVPLPDIKICDGSYRINAYLETVAALEALPQKEALGLLRKWADSNKYNLHIIIICRMLFTPKIGQELRRPRIGGAMSYIGANSSKITGTKLEEILFSAPIQEPKCPLDPIVLVDNIPFLVAGPYISSGPAPESASSYLSYCINNAVWGERRFHPASKEEMEVALNKLLAHFPQRPLNQEELASLRNQMK